MLKCVYIYISWCWPRAWRISYTLRVNRPRWFKTRECCRAFRVSEYLLANESIRHDGQALVWPLPKCGSCVTDLLSPHLALREKLLMCAPSQKNIWRGLGHNYLVKTLRVTQQPERPRGSQTSITARSVSNPVWDKRVRTVYNKTWCVKKQKQKKNLIIHLLKSMLYSENLDA